MSSLEYRSLVEKMDTKLAQEFGNHPGLILWHISNEFAIVKTVKSGFRNI